MSDELIERVARAIKSAWDTSMTAEAEASGGHLDYAPGPWQEWVLEALAALAAIDLPAEREAAARAALEAAAKDAETWFPYDTNKRYPSFGVVESIRAIDPAQFRRPDDADL